MECELNLGGDGELSAHKPQRKALESVEQRKGNYIDDYLRLLFKKLYAAFIFRLQSVRESSTMKE